MDTIQKQSIDQNLKHLQKQPVTHISKNTNTMGRSMQLEGTQILQPLALADLKTHYAGYLLSINHSTVFDNKGNIFFFYYTCTKKSHHLRT